MNKIDIVYTWVDGSDPDWIKKKENSLKKSKLYNSCLASQAGKIRYTDNEELKYSLRSIDLFAPWVNHIYIITDNQTPLWLKKNSKITIVDHKDIIPDEYLPTFNSSVIEAHLHNIEGLSEHFIYFNDDMFLGKLTHPNDFFYKGKPKIFTSSIFQKNKNNKKNTTYNMVSVSESRNIVREKLNQHINFGLRHGVKPMRKSRLHEVFNLYKENLTPCLEESFRLTPFSLIYLYAFHEIAISQAKPTYLRNIKKSNWLPFFPSFSYVKDNNLIEFSNNFERIKPLVFCVNDIQVPLNQVTLFSTGIFSQKSQFES